MRALLLLIVLSCSVAAAEIKVATLNCLLLFDPRIDHRGKLDEEQRMTTTQYETKLGNLTSLLAGYDVVALQEVGGRDEVAALARKAGMQWAWERGNDTATGEEVGLIHRLPGWQVTSRGRVRELDRLVSKHLLVEARNGRSHVYFLVVHLLRPIGTQLPKHKQQVSAIGRWMAATAAADPQVVLVVLGDTNSTVTDPNLSLFGIGTEAGAQIGFRATHLANKAYDRLVVLGPGSWHSVEVRRPPFGARPPADVKRVWTDHFLLGATLKLD